MSTGMAESVIWMEVTQDEYELPVAVADTSRELAALVGVKQSTILEAWSRFQHGMYRRCKYQKVNLGEKKLSKKGSLGKNRNSKL